MFLYFREVYMLSDPLTNVRLISDIVNATLISVLLTCLKKRSVKSTALRLTVTIACSFTVLFALQSLFYRLCEATGFDFAMSMYIVLPVFFAVTLFSVRDYPLGIRAVYVSMYYCAALFALQMNFSLVWIVPSVIHFMYIIPIIYVAITTSVIILLKRFGLHEGMEKLDIFEIIVLLEMFFGVVIELIFYLCIQSGGVYQIADRKMNVASLCISLMLLLLLVSDYIVFRTTAFANIRNKSMEALNTRLEIEAAEYRSQTEKYEKLRSLKHDLRNQYTYMLALLEQKDYTRAHDYCKEITKLDKYVESAAYTSDSAINIMLNIGMDKAASHGIDLEVDADAGIATDIDSVDVCSLLGNLLDNAVEASAKMEGKHGIEVKLEVKKEYLYINVVNDAPSCADGEVREFATSKPDKKNHGYGIRVIKSIAEKYNGSAKFYVSGGKFRAEVVVLAKRS